MVQCQTSIGFASMVFTWLIQQLSPAQKSDSIYSTFLMANEQQNYAMPFVLTILITLVLSLIDLDLKNHYLTK